MKIDYSSAEQIPALKELWKLAFGDGDDFLTPFFDIAYAPDCCRCIAEEGTVAAALYWFSCTHGNQKLAYIYAVATHPDFRGRGLCAALMEDTARLLKQRGYDGILLYPASDALSRMYEKMGYHRCTWVREWKCTASDTSTALREIDLDEFARLRHHFLPSGGVIQEGRILNFLGTLARFYTGGDWLAAISQEDNEIHCYELLGNLAAAPAILCALKVQNGYFRAPGSEKPFAMALGLTEKYTDPGYFGFPLD